MFFGKSKEVSPLKGQDALLGRVLTIMLDGMRGRIMAVDTDLNIFYVNKTVQTYLRSVQDSIRQELPHFDADSLIGKNIDIFHKNPAHQRKMLAALKEPYNTTISISGDVFNLRAFPLFSADGEHLGSAVEWLDPAELDNALQIQAINKTQAVIEFTLDGRVMKANQNFLDVLGYELGEIEGQHHRIFVPNEVAGSAEYAEFWKKLSGGAFIVGQFKRKAKDGRDVWIEASYNPILDMRGRPMKVVKYATDVTAQVEVTHEVVRNISAVSDATADISRQVTMASNSATSTMGNVQAVASGAEEMDASVKEISQNMMRSKEAVNDMVIKASTASESAAKLADISANMTGIVEMIQGIAGQINLLALNATIEAARAGEAGKGFAVVASEVKNLASQAASATEQINEQIAAMQQTSADVTQSVREMGEGMDHVQSYIGTTASAVEEQSAVSQEMAANMQAASSAVGGIVENIQSIEISIQQVNDVARQTAVAAERIIKS